VRVIPAMWLLEPWRDTFLPLEEEDDDDHGAEESTVEVDEEVPAVEEPADEAGDEEMALFALLVLRCDLGTTSRSVGSASSKLSSSFCFASFLLL